MSFSLPRVKLGGAIATTGEQGQMITIPYQALKYEDTAGIPQTTCRSGAADTGWFVYAQCRA
jgi:hypothetical protein